VDDEDDEDNNDSNGLNFVKREIFEIGESNMSGSYLDDDQRSEALISEPDQLFVFQRLKPFFRELSQKGLKLGFVTKVITIPLDFLRLITIPVPDA